MNEHSQRKNSTETRLIKRATRAVIGEIAWQPPAWGVALAGSWRRRHPWNWVGLAFFGIIIATAVLATARWKDGVRPEGVAIQVQRPAHDALKPQILALDFHGSVAPLDKIGKPIENGIRITPEVTGTWSWTGDRRAEFLPEKPWPAGVSYTIRLSPSLVRTGIVLERANLPFSSEPMKLQIKDLQLTIDPKNPAVKEVTATVAFSHPVDAQSFEAALVRKLRGNEDIFAAASPPDAPFWKVTYDQENTVAYLRSPKLSLPKDEAFLTVAIQPGVQPATKTTRTDKETSLELPLPSRTTGLRISSVEVRVVEGKDGEPEHVLVIEATAGIPAEALAKNLGAFRLPKDKIVVLPNNKTEILAGYGWAPGEVDAAVLAKSTPVPLDPIPSEQENPKMHAFRLQAPEHARLFVRINDGLPAYGGFELREAYLSVAVAPEFPREVKIMSGGAVAALHGQRKLQVMTRGIPWIEFQVARVRPEELNHLISQTYGNFQNPEFRNWHFNEHNISECFRFSQRAGGANPAKPDYAVLDLSRHLKPGSDGRPAAGMFFLTVTGRNEDPALRPKPERPVQHVAEDVSHEAEEEDRSWQEAEEERRTFMASDRRFVLVTDLGVLVKENSDDTRDVYVMSISEGIPVQGAMVEVLGKNGLPVAAATTNAAGRATLPSIFAERNDRKPVAFLVRKGDDLSFLPFNREDRKLNLTRFDIGGAWITNPAALDGFLFSDRGIYRPGETVRLGLIVKQLDWQGHLDGLPMELEAVNPRGQRIALESLRLPPGGLAEWTFGTPEHAPTGHYTITANLIGPNQERRFLASSTVRIEEFLPDRLKIRAQLSQAKPKGWVVPEDVAVQVQLDQLFGAPAAGHRIGGRIQIIPSAFKFPEFPDHTFIDPLLATETERIVAEEAVAECETDERGHAKIPLDLSRFDKAAYRLRFLVQGFEKEGGRQVSTDGAALVSGRPFLVGAKVNGALDFVPKGSRRSLELMAVNSDLALTEVEGLRFELTEERFHSVLTKLPNGNWGYQSIRKEHPVERREIRLAAGTTVDLPTGTPGTFLGRVLDTDGLCLAKVKYSVAGAGNLTRSLEHDAELKVNIPDRPFAPGEEIPIHITAPYTGAGLITLERENVVAERWFKAPEVSTVQKFRIPENFDGDGYLHVSFVRGLNSPEIYTSPLSSAVVPFRLSREHRSAKITLEVPDRARPCDQLAITYQADRPVKMVLFGMDEGILQVGRYKLPDPLEHFLRRRALQVETSQILDLILPEFALLSHKASIGGDGGFEELAAFLNPFKKRRQEPVAFWSGIIEAGPEKRSFTYPIPDSFAGSLRVMAVAVNEGSIGRAERSVAVRGPFVLQPNVPLFAAPGDTFEVTVDVHNQAEGSGPNAKVEVEVIPTGNVVIEGSGTSQTLAIAEGGDAIARFKCRASGKLGNADLDFTARAGAESAAIRASMSIRPPVPRRTTVVSGSFRGTSKNVSLTRTLYDEFSESRVEVGILPLLLARGLASWLSEYPHGCTEQVMSQCFPRIALADYPGMPYTAASNQEFIDRAVTLLRTRQSGNGAIGLWQAEDGLRFDLPTLWVVDFLTEASERGYRIPSDMHRRALDHLREMAADTPEALPEARHQAYAIYLLTRNGEVTTHHLERLHERLKESFEPAWKNDVALLYCASSYALLKNMREAERMLAGYAKMPADGPDESDFYSPLLRDGLYFKTIARHFPRQRDLLTAKDLDGMVDRLAKLEFSTLSAAHAIMALQSYGESPAGSRSGPKVAALVPASAQSGAPMPLAAGTANASGAVPLDAKDIQFIGPGKNLVFYQVVQTGFDKDLPLTATAEGIEIIRDYLHADGKPATEAALGEELIVRLRVRSKQGVSYHNVVMIDLLPGGFEVVTESIRGPGGKMEGLDYVDVREDRVVAYGSVSQRANEHAYRIRATNTGSFTTPPAIAEHMYHRTVYAHGTPGRLTVRPKAELPAAGTASLIENDRMFAGKE
jgi:hypothetical protein